MTNATLESDPPFASRRWEVLIGTLIIAGILGTLLSLEAMLRFEDLRKFGAADANVERLPLFYVDKTTNLRRLNPSRKLGGIASNRYGFRGPEIAAKSGGNIVQIAFLGNSTTFDPYSNETQNWPYLVTQKIAADLPRCKLEFINSGVPGAATDRLALIFDTYVKPHNPDLTFLLTTDGDQNMNIEAKAQRLTLFKPGNGSWLARHSLLFDKVTKNARILALMRSAQSGVNRLQPDWPDLESRFSKTMDEAVEKIAASGTRVVLITNANRLRREQSMEEQISAAKSQLEFTPYATMSTLLELQDRYNRVISDTAGKFGAILVGNGTSIPGTSRYYVDSNHFTPAGSQAMAERVARELRGSAAYKQLLESLERRCGAS